MSGLGVQAWCMPQWVFVQLGCSQVLPATGPFCLFKLILYIFLGVWHVDFKVFISRGILTSVFFKDIKIRIFFACHRWKNPCSKWLRREWLTQLKFLSCAWLLAQLHLEAQMSPWELGLTLCTNRVFLGLSSIPRQCLPCKWQHGCPQFHAYVLFTLRNVNKPTSDQLPMGKKANWRLLFPSPTSTIHSASSMWGGMWIEGTDWDMTCRINAKQ